MANKKITELDAVTTLASTDVVPVVDVSADTTNKITAANLFRTLPDGTAAAPALAFSSDAANGVYLAGTDTVGISTGGTQRVTVDGSGNVTISGDLTVSGATTTVESTTVTIDDKNLELGSVATPTDSTADGGGITLKGATDHTIIWTNSTDSWDFSEHVSIASGKEFRIAGTKVLDATSLGSAVVSSSLTSVGTLTGLTVSGNVDLADNNKIQLGAGDDLKLFHDGTNSEINNETGNLLVANKANDADVVIQSDDGSGGITTYVRCDGSNGEVRLYHYGTEKLNTKSDGVDITGELQVSSGTTDVVADFASSDANAWIQIRDNSTTDTAVMVGAVGDDLRFRAGSNEAARITSAGRLGIGTSAPASLLNISASSGGDTSGLRITRTDSGGGDWRIWSSATANGEGAGKLIFANSGNRVAIDSSGKVGVGTMSPNGKFVVSNGGAESFEFYPADASNVNKINYYNRSGSVYCDAVQNAASHQFQISGTEQMRLDSSGRLLLGTTTEGSSSADDLTVATSAETGITIRSGTSSNGNIFFSDGTSGDSEYRGFITYAHNGDSLRFATTNTERLRIDSSGNLNLVSSTSGLTDLNFTASDLGVYARVAGGKTGSGVGDLRFYTYSGGLSEAMRVDSSGRLLLGTTTEGASSADNLTVADSGNCGITIRSGTTSTGNIFFSDGTSGSAETRGYVLYNHNTNAMILGTNDVSRLEINTNGAWGIEGASNYGTSGQVLTSNGNDSPTWQDAGAAVVGGASAISMNDNVKINFGAGDDLQIFHDGTDTYVRNNQGDLILQTISPGDDVILRAHDDIHIQTGGSDNAIVCDNDGAVKLYYNASLKFNTASDGATMTGNLGFRDNDEIAMGDSSDLQIYHNGTNTVIDNRTGDLYVMTSNSGDDVIIQAVDDIFLKPRTGENGIQVLGDGAVKLAYNNDFKFETTSSGVDVTGTTTSDVVNGTQYGSVGQYGGLFGQIRVGADQYGNTIKAAGDTNMNLTVNNAVYFNTGANTNGSDTGTTRAYINSTGFIPNTNNTYDLGTSSFRWRNVYTNDLNLSNEGSTNDVDGTWGNYTIQEGEDDLFLINRRNGKKYKFNLTEVN